MRRLILKTLELAASLTSLLARLPTALVVGCDVIASLWKGGPRAARAASVCGFGALHRELGNTHRALELFDRAWSLYGKLGEHAREESALQAAASAYFDLWKPSPPMTGRPAGRSKRQGPPQPGAHAGWRPASQQARLGDFMEPEFRRLSEWPVAPAAHEWRLYRIDQVSITIERTSGLRASPRAPRHARELLPKTRSHVLCCGQAAPIAALMLQKGARRVESVHPGFEPILVLCEVNGHPSSLGTPSFPAFLKRQEVADLLADPEALIDALVWYDIGGERAFPYLELLKRLRGAGHPGSPIIELQPCASAPDALAEFAALRRGSRSFYAAADELYRQLQRAITNRQDLVAATSLHRLLQGTVSVFFDTDPYGL